MENITTDEFRALAKHAIDSFGTHKLSGEEWDRFAERLTYVPQGAGPEGLTAAVKDAEDKLGPRVQRLHYLSVPPLAAQAVITMLRDADLAANSRVIMEKPFGHDLRSAIELNDFVHDVFDERQIFRIDHFLGKEAAQNILAFRFANGLFEPIWNRNFIDHVQIDIPETLGLDQRANFYESTGAYKDMVVTHLMQVMAFVAMEPPTALEPRAISEEKNKVFRSMLPIFPQDVVRGQYNGYRDEVGVASDSDTETFIALKVGLDNWRWAGTPFYLRTGKKMAEGMRIISIAFKEAPRTMFPAGSGGGAAGARPPHVRPRRLLTRLPLLLRQASRPRYAAAEAVDAVLHAGDRVRGRRAGSVRAAHPRRDARRPHAVHHRRGHREPVGAIAAADGGPAAGEGVPAGRRGGRTRSTS